MFRTDPIMWFRDEAERVAEPQHEIVVYSAADVVALMATAVEQAVPNRVVPVERKRRGKDESFVQDVASDPSPVLEWALLLACTGVRRSEAEALRWTDVDLDHGIIRVHAKKTATFRHIPLIGDPTGDVSPGFVEVLRAWRKRRPNDTYV